MNTADQRFIQYCLKKGLLTTQQVHTLAQKISTSGEKKPIWVMMGEVCSVDPAQFQSNYVHYLTNESQENLPPTISKDHYQILLCIKELVLKGMISIHDINSLMQRSSQIPSAQNFMKALVDRRFISTEQYMVVKNNLDALPTEQIQKKLQQSPILEIQKQGNGYGVVQKTGLQIAHYEILKELGRGGMGVVYLARDTTLSRIVALKVMSNFSNEREKQRFIREAQLAASLKHNNIVSVYEVGESKGVNYFTMEYVEGMSLGEYIQKFQPEMKKRIEIMHKIAEALSFAHSKNVIHRDIKPANIIISTEHQPFLTDFGLAKHIREGNTLTVSGAQIGTPAYMSPEQVNGEKSISKQVDVYGLGAVLYELIVGRPPFIGANLQATFKAITTEDVVPPRKLIKDLPRDINTICLRCLEKRPENRYPNAKAVSLDLERYLEGQTIRTKPVGAATRAQNWIMTNKTLTVIIALLSFTSIFLCYTLFLAPGFVHIHVKAKEANEAKPVVANITIDQNIKYRSGQPIYLQSGYHQVTISLANHKSEDFILNISPGEEKTIEKELIHEKGLLSLTANLSEIEVILENMDNHVKNRLVAPIHRYSLDTGKYKLFVSKTNYFPEEMMIIIEKDQNYELYLDLQPMELWNIRLFSQPRANKIMLSDFNKDGNAEITYASLAGDISCYDLVEQERLWTVPSIMKQNHGSGLLFREDVNRDGFADIISTHHYELVIIDGQTQNTLFSRENWWGRDVIFTDVNNDYYPEIIFFSRYKGMECYDLQNSETVWRQPVNFDTPVVQLNENEALFSQRGEMYIIDLLSGKVGKWYSYYGQQNAEIAVDRTQNNIAVAIANKGMDVVDRLTRQRMWHIPIDSNNIKTPVFCDLDSDGSEEILLIADRLYCISTKTKGLQWSIDLPDNHLNSILAANLDHDHNLEIILFGGGKNIFVLNQNGKLISTFQLPDNVKDCVVFDTNGSGTQEIVCLSSTHLYAFQHTPYENSKTFSEVDRVYYFTNYDFNRDGFKEIVASTTTGELYFIDGKTSKVLWHKQISSRFFLFSIGFIDGDNHIVAYTHNHVTMLHQNGGEIWKILVDDEYTHHPPTICDIDNDGQNEVIVVSHWKGLMYGIKEGKILWRNSIGNIPSKSLAGQNGERLRAEDLGRVFARPLIADIDNDGQLEIVVMNGMQLGNSSNITCFSASSGREKWYNYLPQHAEASDIVAIDSNSDGSLELLVGGVAGNFTSLDAKNGQIIWHKRYRCAGIHYPYLVQDFDLDGKIDIIAKTKDNKLLCINPLSGELKWIYDRDYRYTCDDAVDLNDDNFPEILNLSAIHSGILTSAKDGEWLHEFDHLGIINQRFQFVDIDNDQKKDFLYINQSSNIHCIYNISEYLKKTIKTPNYNYASSDYDFKYALRLTKLLQKKSYNALLKESQKLLPHIKNQDVIKQLQSICYLKEREPQKALDNLLQISKKFPANFETRFLMMLAYFTQKNKEAQKIMVELLQTSVVSFDKNYQKYQDLLTRTEQDQISALLPKTNKITSQNLLESYQHSIFMQQNTMTSMWLEMLIRYVNEAHPNFNQWREKYINEVKKNAARNTTSIYTYHFALDVIDKALQLMPNDYELIALRGQYYLQSSIDTEKGLQDLTLSLQLMPQQSELLFARGQYYYQQQNYTEAFNDFHQSYKFAPENQNLFAVLCLLAQKENNKAAEYIQKTQARSKQFTDIIISIIKQNKQEAIAKMNILAPTIQTFDLRLQNLWSVILPFVR